MSSDRMARPDRVARDTTKSDDLVIDRLRERLLPAATGHRVTDVRVGVGYTGVMLDDGRCGLAYTFRDTAAGRGCNVLDEAGTLAGRTAAELAAFAKAPDQILAAVGLATLNALIKTPDGDDNDILATLQVTAQDEIGMVGNFRPLAGPLRQRVKALHVFEQQADATAGILPAEAEADILPRCQVAIVTATSLLNGTIDGLLRLCRNAHELVILGPSTPLQPEIFAGTAVSVLSGVAVTDGPRALQILSEGGGTKRLRPALRKVNLRIRTDGRHG